MSARYSALADRTRAWFDHPRAVQPAPSADGRTVYFLSDRAGHPEAWSVRLPELTVAPFVRTPNNVGRVQPAPEGDRTVVATDVGGNERWALALVAPDGSTTRTLTLVPDRIHEPGSWRDGRRYVFGSNERDVRFFDVYEVDVERPDPPRLLRAEDAMVTVAMARGERLLLLRNRTNIDREILLRTEDREVLLNPHGEEEAVADVDLGPDGVWAANNPNREFGALYHYRSGGGSPELRLEFPGDLERLKADPALDALALVVNDRGFGRLSVYHPGTGDLEPVALPVDGVVGGIAWAPDGRTLYFELSAATLGTEIFGYSLEHRSVRRVVGAGVPLPGPTAAPLLRQFRATDGLEVPYWEYPSAGTRGTLVVVHGGPEAQARPGFTPLVAFFSELGFRLIVPNVRGSLGYGRTYLHLDDVRRRMDSVRDLRDLVVSLRDDRTGDPREPEPIGIAGGSYGGFMVLSAITTYPDLWKAAIDIVGISNFVTFLERTGPWRRKYREDEYGSLEHDREFLRSISPLHQADRIRVPLLVVHGENDPRVPIYEAEQIVASLEHRGVPVEFLRFADEGHGLARRENQVRTYARAGEFLERYLAPGAGASAGDASQPTPDDARPERPPGGPPKR